MVVRVLVEQATFERNGDPNGDGDGGQRQRRSLSLNRRAFFLFACCAGGSKWLFCSLSGNGTNEARTRIATRRRGAWKARRRSAWLATVRFTEGRQAGAVMGECGQAGQSVIVKEEEAEVQQRVQQEGEGRGLA